MLSLLLSACLLFLRIEMIKTISLLSKKLDFLGKMYSEKKLRNAKTWAWIFQLYYIAVIAIIIAAAIWYFNNREVVLWQFVGFFLLAIINEEIFFALFKKFGKIGGNVLINPVSSLFSIKSLILIPLFLYLMYRLV